MRRYAKAVLAVTAWLMMTALVQADGRLTTVGPDRYPLVVVRGTPYEMGKKLGELTKHDAVEFITTALERVQAAEPQRCSNATLDAAWKSIAPHTDRRFQEELRGLADGTGIPLETIRRAHAIPVVADFSCSSISAWGAATKNGHLYQTRNLDWEMGITAQDHPCIVVYIPNEGIPHVNISFSGCIGSNTGMNAKGIVLSEIGDTPAKDYPFDLNGTHFTTLFRTALYDGDSLEKTLEIFKSADRIKKYHFVIGDGKNLRAAKLRAYAPELTIWHDNDSQDELAPKVLKDLVYHDEGRGAYKPLKSVYGKIGPKEMMGVACKIPIKGANVLDVVYDATALEFWVSYAKKDVEAYKRPFVHVKLKDYLN